MLATSYVIPNILGSLGTRSILFVCLYAAFPMPLNGDRAVGAVQKEVFMSWEINTTDISTNRFVVNPAGITVIFYGINSSIGSATPAFTNRVRNIGNVSLGNVSFRLLNLTVNDVGRYFFKIFPDTIAGGQDLGVAVPPANLSIMAASLPYENKEYKLQCSAQSTSVPLGMGLTMHYQWKRENGQNITVSDRYSFSSYQSTLIINPLKKEDNGTVVCEAWEHVEAVSQSDPFPLTVILEQGTTVKETSSTTPPPSINSTSTTNGNGVDNHQNVIIISASVSAAVLVIIIIICCCCCLHHHRKRKNNKAKEKNQQVIARNGSNELNELQNVKM